MDGWTIRVFEGVSYNFESAKPEKDHQKRKDTLQMLVVYLRCEKASTAKTIHSKRYEIKKIRRERERDKRESDWIYQMLPEKHPVARGTARRRIIFPLRLCVQHPLIAVGIIHSNDVPNAVLYLRFGFPIREDIYKERDRGVREMK